MDLAFLDQALDGFLARLEPVPRPGQDNAPWTAPTPCAEWDVRTLVNHVVGELLWVPPLLDGKTIAEVGDRFDGDVLGDDPHATARRAADDLRRAAAEPGAQARTVHLSFGDFSGGDYLGQIASDVVIHSWDLAKGSGGDTELPEDLVAFVDGFLTPQIEAWRSAGAFGPVVPTAAEATLQQRLVASTGRDPDWTRPAS
jgi:uncharacterized protein (TIGR03086 family)